MAVKSPRFRVSRSRDGGNIGHLRARDGGNIGSRKKGDRESVEILGTLEPQEDRKVAACISRL